MCILNDVLSSFIWKVFLFFMERRNMARKGGAISLSTEFLNFLRFSVTESGAATYTQTEIDTNLSAERGVIMEIHSIELIPSTNAPLLREVGAGSTEQWEAQIVRETKTAIVGLNDPDTVGKFGRQVTRSAAIGTDAGPLYLDYDLVESIWFPKPIPYVKPSIFVGLLSSLSSVMTINGRIGYTLRDISREEFLELLVALQ